MPVTCSSPSQLANSIPCLSCLSKTELLCVMVLALGEANGYTLPGDTNRLLSDAKCVTCLSDKQMLQALTALLANGNLEGKSVTQIRASITCLACANPQQIKAALLNQICQYLT